jgi:leader peptidase (prepilin peptidase)/N-methyltransferase
MDYLSLLILFAFGLIVGSFLNVVILRFNTGMTLSKGRSRCFSCGETLRPRELVPLASFILQSGACRRCGSKISWQYPLVELSGGLAFVAAYIHAPDAFSGGLLSLATFVLTAALLCLYIVIAAYDLRHKIIPDLFSYSAGLVSLGLVAAQAASTGRVDFLQVIAGPALFLFFWSFWYVSKGAWMGLGDGKLALSMGWALGLFQGLAALLLSFWVGAVVSVSVMALQKIAGRKSKLGLKSEIPFGPFLIIGFLAAFLWHCDIQAILSNLAL